MCSKSVVLVELLLYIVYINTVKCTVCLLPLTLFSMCTTVSVKAYLRMTKYFELCS